MGHFELGYGLGPEESMDGHDHMSGSADPGAQQIGTLDTSPVDLGAAQAAAALRRAVEAVASMQPRLGGRTDCRAGGRATGAWAGVRPGLVGDEEGPGVAFTDPAGAERAAGAGEGVGLGRAGGPCVLAPTARLWSGGLDRVPSHSAASEGARVAVAEAVPPPGVAECSYDVTASDWSQVRQGSPRRGSTLSSCVKLTGCALVPSPRHFAARPQQFASPVSPHSHASTHEPASPPSATHIDGPGAQDAQRPPPRWVCARGAAGSGSFPVVIHRFLLVTRTTPPSGPTPHQSVPSHHQAEPLAPDRLALSRRAVDAMLAEIDAFEHHSRTLDGGTRGIGGAARAAATDSSRSAGTAVGPDGWGEWEQARPGQSQQATEAALRRWVGLQVRGGWRG